MSKVIILNGAPGIGKDTIADAIYERNQDVAKLSFKTPMFEILTAMLGTDKYLEFMTRYNRRDTKEQPWHYIGGKSPREMMIYISEDVCKPVFGEQYFGKRLAESAADYINTGYSVIVSDGGFPDEIVPLVASGLDVHVVRLHSEWFTFDGDSRSLIYMSEEFKASNPNYHEHDISLIRGDIEGGVAQVMEILNK